MRGRTSFICQARENPPSNAKRGRLSFLCQSLENNARPSPVVWVKSGCNSTGCWHRVFFCSWNKRKYDQWWEVKFVGEGIIDQVGWYKFFFYGILSHARYIFSYAELSEGKSHTLSPFKVWWEDFFNIRVVSVNAVKITNFLTSFK